MTKPTIKPVVHVIDLSNYAKKILAAEDRPLFDDAVAAGNAGALRAAYVMIWLACAESLKRRFREAQKRDGAAGKIVGEIEDKEREHKAVDKLVLEKAHEYGFISDSGQTILNHVYEMRCLYGHPYEEAPSQEQVSHAAAVVVEYVLSKPIKLKYGFCKQLLNSLLEDRSYLDDQDTTVTTFTKDILPRLDESIYGWLLDNYWKELEKLAEDPSMAIFFRRGIWFCRTMLSEFGVDVFSPDDWHDRTRRFPKILIRVCTTANIFKELGKRAQDSLVGSILDESDTHASVLRSLERLSNDGALSNRQHERFAEHVLEMKSTALRSSGLRTKTCYESLITAMESYNWYVQNPAIDLIMANGPDKAAELDEDQQICLGRNILQAGEGSAASAYEFLDKLSKGETSWPLDVVRGIFLETFINEKNEIRFKDRHIDRVLSAIDHLKNEEQKQLIEQLAALIKSGTPKKWIDQKDFDRIIESLRGFSWTAPLIKSLDLKAASLPDAEGDE